MSRDILRNPPRVIDPDQRIKYGVVQALVGMAECALADLIQVLEGMIDEENDATLSDDQINRALMLAWSIVDQADLLRHLIESEGDSISAVAKEGFFSTVANLQELRNWMRHIPQRIKNYRLIHK